MVIKDEQRLIDDYIDRGPAGSPAEARVRDTGPEVFTLILYGRAVGNDVARIARDYELSLEAVQAAFAYYRRHPALIDARLLLHTSAG